MPGLALICWFGVAVDVLKTSIIVWVLHMSPGTQGAESVTSELPCACYYRHASAYRCQGDKGNRRDPAIGCGWTLQSHERHSALLECTWLLLGATVLSARQRATDISRYLQGFVEVTLSTIGCCPLFQDDSSSPTLPRSKPMLGENA